MAKVHYADALLQAYKTAPGGKHSKEQDAALQDFVDFLRGQFQADRPESLGFYEGDWCLTTVTGKRYVLTEGKSQGRPPSDAMVTAHNFTASLSNFHRAQIESWAREQGK